MKRRASGYKRVSEPLGFRTLDEIKAGRDSLRGLVRKSARVKQPTMNSMEWAQSQLELEQMKLNMLRKELKNNAQKQ